MAIRMLEAETAFAEVNPARDARLHHPLEGVVDRRTADARVLRPDELDQLVRRQVSLLAQEDADDDIALAGPAAARGPPRLDELGR